MKKLIVAIILYTVGSMLLFLSAISAALDWHACLAFMLSALLVLPFVRRRVHAVIPIAIRPGVRALLVMSLAFAGIIIAGMRQTAEIEAQVKQQAQIEPDQQHDEFIHQKPKLLKSARDRMAAKKFEEAQMLLAPYSKIDDPDLAAMSNEITRQLSEEKKAERKKLLLHALTIVPEDNYSRRAELYRELSSIEPNNKTYRENTRKALAKFDKQQGVVVERERRRTLGTAWRYQDEHDDMSSGTIHYAYINSTNELNFNFPYQGSQRATLVLRQHPRWGLNVYVQVERGQFMPCAMDDCTATVRFDDGSAASVSLSAPSDMSTTLRFIESPGDLVRQLRRAKTFRIQVPFYSEGNQTLQFDVSELDWE